MVALSVNVMRTPVVLALYTLRDSVRFFDMARLIGIIELNNGMKIPISKA